MAYKIVNGVAVPQDLATLGVFQGLQRAANAFASHNLAKNLDVLTIDGEIGPRTLQRVTTLIYFFDPHEVPPPDGVDSLARQAAFYATAFMRTLDQTPDFTARPHLPDSPMPGSAPRAGARLAVAGGLAALALLWAFKE